MKNKKYGFTLIEAILTIALIGIITPVIYSLLFSGQKNFKLGTEEVYEQQDDRLLRDYLAKELRYVSYISNDEPIDADYKYYSLELDDRKIKKREYNNINNETNREFIILSFFKGVKIDFKLIDNVLDVEYVYNEVNNKENYTILLENSSLANDNFEISSSESLYYANYEDTQNIEKNTEELEEYVQGQSYEIGDIVLFNEKTYKCDGPNCSKFQPGKNAHWQEIK